MKKVIILVVIILVVAGAAVGIYLWKKGQEDGGGAIPPGPKPKPKAGFEIYANTKHGFSLEYPEDWYLVDNPEFNSVFFSSKEEEAPMGGVSLGARIEMFMIENSEGLSLEKWIEQSCSQEPEEEIMKEEEITVGGKKAVKVVVTPREGPVEAGPPITVYVAKNNYIIQINYTGRETGLETDYFGNIENFEHFLGSFSF